MNQPLDELSELWLHQAGERSADMQHLLTVVEGRASDLERKISRRNWRESVAGIASAGFCSWLVWWDDFWLVKAGAAIMALGSLWVVIYLRRYGRAKADPSLEQSLVAYTDALLKQYDHQIQVLIGAKYWYILPMYIGMMVFIAGMTARLPREMLGWTHVARPVVVTAAAVLAWWLNEVKAVGWLHKEREHLLAMLGLDGSRAPDS